MNEPGLVYAILNTRNEKRYIGQTANLKRRISSHFSQLRLNKHPSSELQSDFNQYGDGIFEVEVLRQNIPQPELHKIEDSFIVKFNTIENGYNGRRCANWYEQIPLILAAIQCAGSTGIDGRDLAKKLDTTQLSGQHATLLRELEQEGTVYRNKERYLGRAKAVFVYRYNNSQTRSCELLEQFSAVIEELTIYNDEVNLTSDEQQKLREAHNALLDFSSILHKRSGKSKE